MIGVNRGINCRGDARNTDLGRVGIEVDHLGQDFGVLVRHALLARLPVSLGADTLLASPFLILLTAHLSVVVVADAVVEPGTVVVDVHCASVANVAFYRVILLLILGLEAIDLAREPLVLPP